MVIKLSKRSMMVIIIIILLAGLCYGAVTIFFRRPTTATRMVFAGGSLHSPISQSIKAVPVISQEEDLGDERFHRPSKDVPYPNPYSFKDFEKEYDKPPLIQKKFENPEDLVLAYYGILRDASNLDGYSGGCGTVGQSRLPYPYAYQLLTKDKRKTLSLKAFENSFIGTGYTTLLKILPAYTPPGTPENIKYYFVEIEVITGAKDGDKNIGQGGHFAYYYGLITVEKTEDGWKIKDIDYLPEDFLCAPIHMWFYLSDAVVDAVYSYNLKLVDHIDKIEKNGNLVSIYASGKGNQYRFDFVRITNGYDILLHEYILENGEWKETSLLTDNWKNFKLTIDTTTFDKSL